MIHTGKNTKSIIISKGISTGLSVNNYRGIVKVSKKGEKSKNFSQCDSILLNKNSSASTYLYYML